MIMGLTAELIGEHKWLVETLNNAKKQGLSSPEGLNTLKEAKAGLLGHLKKEDEQLYPKMNKAAETDEALKRTLNTFAKDMDGVSKAAMDFFEKYNNGGSGVMFSVDFGKLLGALAGRVRKEENILYKEFDKL
jgi:hypothetical protein